MLLSLTPGAWEHSFGWLVHVRWEGLSIYPTCALILLGVAANAAWPAGRTARLAVCEEILRPRLRMTRGTPARAFAAPNLQTITLGALH
jgi:hypothetical protein